MPTDTPFDLLITDLGMPGMDGRQLARQAKGRYPALPVVMLTGWGSVMKDGDEDSAIIDAVLGKPPRLDELGELVARLATRAARARLA